MNGFYVYFDDGGKIYGGKNRRWVYCDNVKGITDTRDFYPLNDFIIDAVHVFNSAKSAQKFIDVDCKYFDEQPNLKISEIPNDISSWYESKKITNKSLKESNNDIKYYINELDNLVNYHNKNLTNKQYYFLDELLDFLKTL